MYGSDGMVIGIMKKRIENYKEIVRNLLNNQKLSEKQRDFLKKEKVLE